MPNGTSSNSPRRPWMATAIWGWRLEIVLTLGTFFVLALAARIVAFGPLLRHSDWSDCAPEASRRSQATPHTTCGRTVITVGYRRRSGTAQSSVETAGRQR